MERQLLMYRRHSKTYLLILEHKARLLIYGTKINFQLLIYMQRKWNMKWKYPTSSVLRCVAVCCSVLPCVTVCCSGSSGNTLLLSAGLRDCMTHWSQCCHLKCVAVSCSVLQCVAVCWGVLQCVAVCCSVSVLSAALHDCMTSVLQCVEVCCSVLQCVLAPTHCNTLQHTATHCNTLQHNTSLHDCLTSLPGLSPHKDTPRSL